MNDPSYIIERHPHGWLLKADGGIPIAAFQEAMQFFPKDAALWPGIANAMQCVAAVATDNEGRAWEREITEDLERRCDSAELRWLRGLDIGMSSRAIFYHLTDSQHYKNMAAQFREPPCHVPSDASDFGRCSRLLAKMGWQSRITEMATALPTTKWPNLVAAWPELEEMLRLGKGIELTKRIRELTA